MFIVTLISFVVAQNLDTLSKVQELMQAFDAISQNQSKEFQDRASNTTWYAINETIKAYKQLSGQQQEYYNSIIQDMSRNFQTLNQDQVTKLEQDYIKFFTLRPEEQESFFALLAQKIQNLEQNKVTSQEFFTGVYNFIDDFINHPVIVENNWHLDLPGKGIKLFDKFQTILDLQSPQTREKAHQVQNAVMYEVRKYYNSSNTSQQLYLKDLAYNITQLTEEQIESIGQDYTEFLNLNQSQQETLLTIMTPDIQNFTQSQTDLSTMLEFFQTFVKQYYQNPYVLPNTIWNLSDYDKRPFDNQTNRPDNDPNNRPTNPQNHTSHNHTHSIFHNLTDEQINTLICEEVVVLESLNQTTEEIRQNISQQIELSIHNTTKRLAAIQRLSKILESHANNKFHNKSDAEIRHVIDIEVHNLEQLNYSQEQIVQQISQEIEEGIHDKARQITVKQLLSQKLQRIYSGKTDYTIYYLYIGLPFAVLIIIGGVYLVRRHFKVYLQYMQLKNMQNSRNLPYRVPDLEEQSTD